MSYSGRYGTQAPSISGIEDYAAPQPPRRRCKTCPTLLRQSNPGTMCAVCERKAIQAEMRREAAKRVRPRTESLNERLLRYQRESA